MLIPTHISSSMCCVSMDGQVISRYSDRIELTFQSMYHIKCRMHYNNGDVVDYTVDAIVPTHERKSYDDERFIGVEIQVFRNTAKHISYVHSAPTNFIEYWKRPIEIEKNYTDIEDSKILESHIKWLGTDLDRVESDLKPLQYKKKRIKEEIKRNKMALELTR